MSSTATSSPNAANVLEPIAEDMQQVNRVIRQRLASEVMLINQISEYIIGAGGKRLRPALLLLMAGAASGKTTAPPTPPTAPRVEPTAHATAPCRSGRLAQPPRGHTHP